MLGDLVGWTLVAVTTAMAEDGRGHQMPTVQTLMFRRVDGRSFRTVAVSAAGVDAGDNWLPFLDLEELK